MSSRRELAEEVLNAYKSWDIERILVYRADNCIHQIAPASLDQPARDNAAYRQYFGAMMPLFRSFEPTIHSIVEDPRANTAAVWCSSVSDTVVGRYANEYVLLLHFSPGGDKVERIVEFVDSAYSREFFGRLGRFVAERAGGQAQAQAAGGKEEEEGEEEQGAKKPS